MFSYAYDVYFASIIAATWVGANTQSYFPETSNRILAPSLTWTALTSLRCLSPPKHHRRPL